MVSNFSSEKSERCGQMSAPSEASGLVRRVAEPRPVGDSVKAAIRRASRRLGFSPSRTKDLWYSNARRIDAEEMDALRRAARQRREEDNARADACLAIERLVALRAALAAADENFHRATIAALDDALRGMGTEIRAVAVREN